MPAIVDDCSSEYDHQEHSRMFVVLSPRLWRYLEARAIIVLLERFGIAINLGIEIKIRCPGSAGRMENFRFEELKLEIEKVIFFQDIRTLWLLHKYQVCKVVKSCISLNCFTILFAMFCLCCLTLI